MLIAFIAKHNALYVNIKVDVVKKICLLRLINLPDPLLKLKNKKYTKNAIFAKFLWLNIH